MAVTFRSKRAISPLIAVVLLIVVVVGVGALVTGIVRNLVEEQKTQMRHQADMTSCSRDVVVTVITVDNEHQICMGNDYVNVVLENTGSIDIDDFQLMVFGTTGLYRNDSWGTGLAIGDTAEVIMNFLDVARDDVEQIKIIPKLKKTGETGYYYCTETAIVYDGLDTCS